MGLFNGVLSGFNNFLPANVGGKFYLQTPNLLYFKVTLRTTLTNFYEGINPSEATIKSSDSLQIAFLDSRS